MARVALVKCSLPPGSNLLVTPPVGVLSLASVLRNRGHQVKVMDVRLRPERDDWVRKELRSFSPDIVGLSALTQEAKSMHRLAALAREIPGMKYVVAGGPHASSYAEACLDDENIDFLVIGEGERTMAELVSRLDAGGSARNILGTAMRENGEIFLSDPRPFIENIDTLPPPAWDLAGLEAYARTQRMGLLPRRRYAALITSRGCPFLCGYCHRLLGKKFRARSPENVLEEIDLLYRKYGVREFEIDDDIFNLDRERVLRICELVISRGYRVRLAFPNGLRGDLADYEVLRMLRRAGTYLIAMAVETAAPRFQRILRKNLDIDRVIQAVRDCRKLGITTLGFFMLGFPGETREELLRTIDLAVGSPFDFATFFVVSPFRGTDLFTLAGEVPRFVPSENYRELDFHQGQSNLSTLPDDEFQRLKRRAYRQFYLRRIHTLLLRGSFRKVSWGNGIRQFLVRAQPWKGG